ncbi:MAG: hypothetical protein IPN67_19965 [Bacteroidales bacterium]|nr:hypothetical protein [Bacteroidales bacterium]
MKKIMLMMMMAVMIAVCGMAQSSATLMTYSGDTVTNTGTKYLLQKVDTRTVDLVSFQVVNKKVSGTPAGYTLFQASNDAVNYVTLDTLTNTNVNYNSKIFVDNPAKYLWYKITTTGSGTMVMTTKGYAILRKNK